MIGGGMVPQRACRVPVFPRDVARVAAATKSDRADMSMHYLLCV